MFAALRANKFDSHYFACFALSMAIASHLSFVPLVYYTILRRTLQAFLSVTYRQILKMGYSINKMIAEIKKRGNIMAGLAKNLNSLIAGNRQQRKKILLFMEWISKTKKFLLSLRMIWKNPVDAKASSCCRLL
ncbi:MAG: hypothetical protein ACLRXQ_11180 [Phascolarctobacterium faecium]